MILNQFPCDFKSDLDRKTNQQVQIENQKCSDEQKRIYNSKKVDAPVSSKYTNTFGIIGFIVGVFPCLMVAGSINGVGMSTILTGLLVWGLCIAGGAGIGSAIYSSRKASVERNDQEIKDLQDQERENADKRISEIKDNANREYREYFRQFEAQAQTDSVRFAESELAVKVIDWISGGYIRTIEAADRRSHIASITVPFIFNVYRNKITCNLGEFNFELERCKNLSDPLEQTALARAIASSIQVNVAMKYPADPSGTDYVLNTSYEYFSDHVAVTLMYTAPNGYFKAVQGW